MARSAAKQSKAVKAGPKPSRKTGAQSAPPSRYRQRLGRLLREAVLFVAAAITLFLLASLITFSPNDPGWASVGDGTAIDNLFGRPGAWFADVLLSLFGVLGFIFPFMVLYGGWLVFVNRNQPGSDPLSKSIRAASLILCLVAACGLAWLIAGSDAHSTFPQGSGGIVGAAAAQPVMGVINFVGAAWLLITVFVITLSMGLGFSWLSVAERIGHLLLGGLSGAARGLFDRLGAWRANRQERRAVRAARKAGKRKAPVFNEPASAQSVSVQAGSRVAPTLDAVSNSSVTVRNPKSDKASKRTARKATQLNLPMDAQVDVPPYDPAKDSPIPPTALLDPARESRGGQDKAVLQHMSEMLEQHLADYKVQAKVDAV
jgi:S-DNA-T family DNA segregation ATPase FtsK/SpoIIIE